MRCVHCKGDSVICKACGARERNCTCAAGAVELSACPQCEDGYTPEPKVVIADAPTPNADAAAEFAGAHAASADPVLDLSQALVVGDPYVSNEYLATYDTDSEPDEDMVVPEELMP